MPGIVGILLAAGASARFGANKLLVPLDDGTPVAVAAARRLRTAVRDAVAVVRPDDDVLPLLLREAGLRTVVCHNAARGMGASLAAGVNAGAAASGWLVALADMPWIAESTIRAVAQALAGGARIAAPYHDGERGHPVGFAAEWRGALLAADGDAGARDVLRRYARDVVRINVTDPGVLRDVDHPADIAPAER
jgi:molybdenum cofactor cytidylyltransferase